MSDGTVIDELLVCLRRVDDADLDGLQILVASNDLVDRASPPLGAWLTNLVNAERNRRQHDGEDVYPIAEFENWQPRLLVQNASLSLVLIESAMLAAAPPAVMQFVLRLAQLLVGLSGLALIELTEPPVTR